MLIYCREKHELFNLTDLRRIHIWKSNLYDCYILSADIGGEEYWLCTSEDRELLEKLILDIYMHMTYASGNYILDLNEFKERTDEKT